METNETLQNESIENNAADTSEKLFSQDEVNKIISARLKRYKALEGDQEQAIEDEVKKRVDIALSARVADLDKRELKLNCREYIQTAGYPAELLDAISADDLEEFKTKADTIYNAIVAADRPNYPELRSAATDYYRAACQTPASLNRNIKHVPKEPRYI